VDERKAAKEGKIFLDKKKSEKDIQIQWFKYANYK
jgi:hypothetical protein